MSNDSDVIVYGEDVGVEGGVFRATVGLREEFGPERCFDTPLSEAGIVGTAMGMAVAGLKPVVEIQFSGFIYTAFNQIVNHLSRLRNRTRGALTVPMVIRMPYGAGIGAPEHHMESMEAMFGHIPGLKVVIPSTPYDAKGLLISAIRDPDPVLFMEPKRVYRSIKQEVPEQAYAIGIGRSRVIMPGCDVTIVSYGAQMREASAAAAHLKKSGVSAELIDLRTVFPMDTETILESVRKTGRLIVVQEGPHSFGVAAEIIATVVEEAFVFLEAPPVRLTGADTIVPLAKSEHLYMIRTEDIVAAVQAALDYRP
jgi:pyruvate dehydrogenase E1 component beta subunit